MKKFVFYCRCVVNTVVVVWAVLFGRGAAVQAADLKVGDDAPPFTMKGSDGKTYSLQDFAGKQAVVLAWFPKAFTRGCTKECHSFQTDSKDIKAFDVAYFTASVDTPEKNADFAKSPEVGATDYAILADPTKEVATAYGVLGKTGFANRWTFYISKDGKILAIDKKVQVATHGKDVAAKLKELGVPESKTGKS